MKTPATPAAGPEETFSRTCVIGITQFVFLALGLMVLTILVKVSTIAREATPLAQFLTSHGLWLAVIPLGWTFFAGALANRTPLAAKIANATGIGLAVLIGVVFAVAILRPTG